MKKHQLTEDMAQYREYWTTKGLIDLPLPEDELALPVAK